MDKDGFVFSGSSPTEPDFLVENHFTVFLLTPSKLLWPKRWDSAVQPVKRTSAKPSALSLRCRINHGVSNRTAPTKGDSKLIVSAASAAQKADDYIRNIAKQEETEARR